MSTKAQITTDAPQIVDDLLDQAVQRQASDVHFEPTAHGYDILYRIDGLLDKADGFDAATGRSLVARLMVLAKLLTYRQDVPQEGRLSVAGSSTNGPIDLRLAIMPTTHGLRAAVRLPAELTQPRNLDQLQLPSAVLDGLKSFAATDAGMLILVGPAGSGKTTTIYALLDHIAQHHPGQSLIALEDPVERDLAGITQIEVTPFGELTYERALRSIVRQDPQVLMLGEIRDGDTATIAVQAALSGHRLICTMHAATPGSAIARLLEMGIKPYQVTSALFGVVAIRLLRRRGQCGDHLGRIPVAELAVMDQTLRDAVLAQADAQRLQDILSQQDSYVSLDEVAADLVARELTDADEVRRVLG